jgi:hypothetical protein
LVDLQEWSDRLTRVLGILWPESKDGEKDIFKTHAPFQEEEEKKQALPEEKGEEYVIND